MGGSMRRVTLWSLHVLPMSMMVAFQVLQVSFCCLSLYTQFNNFVPSSSNFGALLEIIIMNTFGSTCGFCSIHKGGWGQHVQSPVPFFFCPELQPDFSHYASFMFAAKKWNFNDQKQESCWKKKKKRSCTKCAILQSNMTQLWVYSNEFRLPGHVILFTEAPLDVENHRHPHCVPEAICKPGCAHNNPSRQQAVAALLSFPAV